ncbi:MAG: signal peptidase [Patescibacteria group bacterium]|nr:signal peptidase [Patescibacteria group bacterium]
MEHSTPHPHHNQPAPAPKDNKEGLKSILTTLGLLILAPLLAIFLTSFIFQSYEVDGPSMETTLYNQDRLVVVKLQRTWSRLTGNDYIPNRGDVIIFNQPNSSLEGTSKRQLIKRVVALPGERVVITNGYVTVYNEENPNGFSPDKTLPYGKVINQTEGEVDMTVPANEVFVLGDNRGNSLDSRYFGTLPASDIVGKLGLRVYPFNQTKVF